VQRAPADDETACGEVERPRREIARGRERERNAQDDADERGRERHLHAFDHAVAE
jgi:hypothetical protein